MSFQVGATTPRRDWTTSAPQKSIDLGAGALNALPPMILNLIKQQRGGALPVIQPTGAALVLHVITAKLSEADPVTIFASLENSVVASGAMYVNKADQKGYFQSQVKVEM